jgi:hypothetical protein
MLRAANFNQTQARTLDLCSSSAVIQSPLPLAAHPPSRVHPCELETPIRQGSASRANTVSEGSLLCSLRSVHACEPEISHLAENKRPAPILIATLLRASQGGFPAGSSSPAHEIRTAMTAGAGSPVTNHQLVLSKAEGSRVTTHRFTLPVTLCRVECRLTPWKQMVAYLSTRHNFEPPTASISDCSIERPRAEYPCQLARLVWYSRGVPPVGFRAPAPARPRKHAGAFPLRPRRFLCAF